MLYLLDTANLKAIEKINYFLPLDGVTTNPTIIAKEHTAFLPLLKNIHDIIGKDKALHAQILGQTFDEIIKEAHYYQENIKGTFYVKVPVSINGVKAITVLKEQGFKVTATAIFTAQQALIAARAGADFVAPYVNRIDNHGSSGIETVKQILNLFKQFSLNCKVLGASFKNTRQISELADLGCHAATMPADLIQQLLYHPLTDISIKQFENDWLTAYQSLTVINPQTIN